MLHYTLHYITLHNITLHITLHITHYITHYIAHYTLHYVTHYIYIYIYIYIHIYIYICMYIYIYIYITQYMTLPITLPVTLHYPLTLHFPTLPVTLHYPLHYNTWHLRFTFFVFRFSFFVFRFSFTFTFTFTITLRYITLHYVYPLRCITLHYIALRDATRRDVTQHNTTQRPRRTGGHSCWQQRLVSPCLRLSSSTEWMSFQLFFEVIHTEQTVQNTVEISVFVGNVSVIMQRQFQQSLWYRSEVPQTQFIDRVFAFSCTTETCFHSANCAENRRESTGACANRGSGWDGDGGEGFFCCILRHFSDSSSRSWVLVFTEFSALDDSQLWVVEGSGVPKSLGVLLPGDSALGLCQLIPATCGHTHPDRRTATKTTTTTAKTQPKHIPNTEQTQP